MIGEDLKPGGATVIQGRFPAPAAVAPDWVKTAMKKHSGLAFKRIGECYYLEGVDVTLPNGKTIDGEAGYLRLTGQWREDIGQGYDVECFCCKTGKTGWVPSRLLIGVRLVDNL